jgi:hypothetical protein
MTGGRSEASPSHREEGESPGHSCNGGSCNPQFSIQCERFSYRTLHNDLLSNQACVLTGKARELCDSLGQDQLNQIDDYAWTYDTTAA